MGKMKPRSTGPHTFIRYEGKLGTVAVIFIRPGRELKVSASNLLPVDSQLARERHVTKVFPDLYPTAPAANPRPTTKRPLEALASPPLVAPTEPA